MRRFERFVTIGDSTAEGIGDFGADGRPRGFADRLAEHLAACQGKLAYANLAISGYVARQVRDRQLGPALAMRPDLVAIMAGMNDLLSPRFDVRAVADDLATMQHGFASIGATILAFTVPDVAHRLAFPPVDRVLSRRIHALDEAIRKVSTAHGAIVIDLAAHPMSTDPRMWDRDRLHGNPDSHARIADWCADVLGFPARGYWREVLPREASPGVATRVAGRLDWSRRYLVPWLVNKLRRLPPRTAKHVQLVPLVR